MELYKKKITSKKLIIAILAYSISIIIYGIIVFFLFRDSRNEISQAGSFGDMFGAFNAFFTGLAFLAVGLALYLQIIDTTNTKISAHNSQVENTFFNMMSLLNQIIDFMKHENKSGREYFHYVFEEFKRIHIRDLTPVKMNIHEDAVRNGSKENYSRYKFNSESFRPHLEKIYEKFYSAHHYNLGHYFRYLYNIVKYIKISFPDNIDLQNKYIGIIQAQMSNDELGLLFYNVLSIYSRNSEGKDKFREWLDEYNFFQNLDKKCILEDCYTEYFPKTVFKYKLHQLLKIS